MKTIKIQDLRAILCIAEEKQISAAATRLGSSQANLSRLLASFEEQVGLKIFHRSTRHLSLTEFGETLLPRVTHLLQAHEETINFIDAYKKKPLGHITIAAPSGAIVFLTRHIMPSIAAEHPDISISFVTHQPQPDIDEQGTAMSPDWDILFSLHMPKDENLIARPVASFRTGLFASPEYLAAHSFEDPQDISNHPCILHQLLVLGGNQNMWQYRDNSSGEIKNLIVSGNYICDHSQPAIELAKHGLGLLYAPLYVVVDELEAGALLPCFPGEFQVEQTSNLYLIYRKRDYQPYRVHVIIDAIIKYLNIHSILLK
ncbi:LysR family transcriptional regulator [Aeromonas sp. 602200]|uniref:LysR family transcriptional regulator n=1 Tax=Aeromonas sp. 602200 TaxID=2712040 RepID=UPI003BA1C9CC